MPSCLVGVALKWYHSMSLHAKATHNVLDVADGVHVVGILSTARLEKVEMVVWDESCISRINRSTSVPTTTTSMVGDQSMAVRTINVPASPASYFT